MAEPQQPPLFGIGTSVYARRGDDILILKRAAGEFTESWYVPGGAIEPGETPEECAVRELREESGLEPDGPLALIGAVPMKVYGYQILTLSFACDVERGEVKLSHEHSEARWVRPERYRDEFFTEERVAAVEARSERVGRILRGIREDLGRYLRWLERERAFRGA